ncbi:MAG: hypothetical protein KAS46_03895 [Candidatus Aureabacteria bacterium]|nr:hypothetical protein [Candidatus Auribacterota bacterium]
MRTIFFYVKHISMLKSWVNPIAFFLKKKGYNLVVLHVTNLNREIASVGTNITKDYELIDISYKSSKAILRIFQEHKPIGMIVLTFRSLFDLLINRIAQQCNVKTLYLEHGFFADITALRFGMANKKASIRRYLHFIGKYVYFIFFIARNIFFELHIIYRAMKRNDYSKTQYDYALFYANYGFQKTNKLFKYDSKKVFFSGYPTTKNKSDINCFKKNLCVSQPNIKKKILFIQQPLLLDKLSNISYAEEAQYLRKIANISAEAGYEFVFQVHPRENSDRYAAVFKECDGIVVKSSSVEKSVAESEIVLGHFSTALFFGVVLSKPIILLYYPGLDGQYLDYFKMVGVKASNIKELSQILSNPSIYFNKSQEYEEFIKEYIGQNNSFENQAQIIDEIVCCSTIRK